MFLFPNTDHLHIIGCNYCFVFMCKLCSISNKNNSCLCNFHSQFFSSWDLPTRYQIFTFKTYSHTINSNKWALKKSPVPFSVAEPLQRGSQHACTIAAPWLCRALFSITSNTCVCHIISGQMAAVYIIVCLFVCFVGSTKSHFFCATVHPHV